MLKISMAEVAVDVVEFHPLQRSVVQFFTYFVKRLEHSTYRLALRRCMMQIWLPGLLAKLGSLCRAKTMWHRLPMTVDSLQSSIRPKIKIYL